MSLLELQPDTRIHEVICEDVNAHDTIWDHTSISNTRYEYFVDAVIDANRKFLNDPEQPTRQDPAMGTFSSPDAMIVNAAFRDRYDGKLLDALSSDHRPILITIHLPTEKLRGERLHILDWWKGDRVF